MKRKLFSLFLAIIAMIVGTGGAMADNLCSYEFSNSGLSKTTDSATGTNCTVAWSSLGATSTASNCTVLNSIAYWKLTSDAAYVKITLTGDSFISGDVLSIDAYMNSTSDGKGFYIKSRSGNSIAQTGTKKAQAFTYTLKSADINEDGSITLYRIDSNSYIHGIAVTGTRSTTVPTITTDLFSTADVTVGIAQNFSIVASGATSYQWYKNTSASTEGATAISGATSDSYTYTASAAGTEYLFCAATNSIGTTNSVICVVTATAASSKPSITTDLESIYSVGKGKTLDMSIVAEGAASYQWYTNNSASTEGATAISGATSDSYTYTGTTIGTEYIYCVASNTVGDTQSQIATVSTTGSTACQLTSVQFSNTVYGSIAEADATAGTVASVTVPYMAGTTAPTVERSSIAVSEGATATVDGSNIVVTAEDGTTNATYAITTKAITPLTVSSDVETTAFTEVPSWVYSPYGYDSSKGLRFAKAVNDASNMRISKGNTRQYYFISAAETLTLTSFGTSRDINVYVNGTNLASPTASGTSTIDITLDKTQANMVCIESNQTGGDGGFTKYALKSVDTRTASDLTVSATEVTVTAEATTNVTYTTSATVAPTVASSNTNVATASIDTDAKTITITGVADGTATITLTQSGDAAYKDDAKTITVTVGAGSIDYILDFTKDWASDLSTSGAASVCWVTSTTDGVPTYETSEPASYIMYFKGYYKNSTYGLYYNPEFQIPLPKGSYKVSLGCSDYGGDVPVTAGSETLATINNKGAKYSQDKTAISYTYVTLSDAATLKLAVSGGNIYFPYIRVEKVDAVPASYTVTFKNGETTVQTSTVYEGTGLGSLPADPTVESNQQFIGWYTATDGTGSMAETSTVPTADVTYLANIKTVTVENGYVMTDNSGSDALNGENLVAAILYGNANSKNIFVKNGTYDLKSRINTEISTANMSLIGESMSGVVIKCTPAVEGINSAAIKTTGDNVLIQDMTIQCYAPQTDGNERGVAIWNRSATSVIKNVYQKGTQDTYYTNYAKGKGQIGYVDGGKIEGTVDFICGAGNHYFDGVQLYAANSTKGAKTKTTGDYLTAPNTYTDDAYGYVFKDAVIDGESSQAGTYYLARAWNNEPRCTYINRTSNIAPATDLWTKMSNFTGTSHFADLTEEDDYTMSNVLGSYYETAVAAATDAEVSDAKVVSGSMSWASDASLFLIEDASGNFVAITADKTYDGKAGYTVRAANARGAFGEAVTVVDPYAPTEIFSMSVAATSSQTADSEDPIDLTSEFATIVGGSAKTGGKASQKYIDKSSSAYYFKIGGSNQYFHATLDKALAVGDVITYETTDSYELSFTADATRTTDNTTSSHTYTVTATDGLAGSTSLYIWRAGSSTTVFNNLTVSRPATVATPTINAKGYGTFSCAQNVQITGAKVYKAILNTQTNKVTCTEIVSGKVPAGTGVLLYKEGVTEATTATALYVDAADAIDNNDLKATTLADGSLADIESSLALSGDTFMNYTGSAFKPGKAYFPYSSNAKDASFTIVFDGDEATAINAVEGTKVNNDAAYNLAGLRVNANAKGIVIINGKKYINK